MTQDISPKDTSPAARFEALRITGTGTPMARAIEALARLRGTQSFTVRQELKELAA